MSRTKEAGQVQIDRLLRQAEELLSKRRAEKEFLEKLLDSRSADSLKCKREQEIAEEARNVVNAVLELTQSQIKEYIEDICTLALRTVFDDDYGVSVDFRTSGGRSEASIKLVYHGLETEMDSVGGGVLDVLGLALRFCLFSLRKERGLDCFVLDEPAKHLSSDLRRRLGILLKKFSEMFGVQMIVVSHDDQLIEQADKVFYIRQINGCSVVESRTENREK